MRAWIRLAIGLSIAALASAATAAPFAYITNGYDGTVSVIDTATNRVTATIPVGMGPVAVAVNPAGTRVYVGNIQSASVSVIDTAANSVVAEVSLDDIPFGISVDPAGARIYVTGALYDDITVIDAATNLVSRRFVAGGGPMNVAFDPTGVRAYVANVYDDTLAIVDIATYHVVATIPVGYGPQQVVVDRAGARAYVPTLDDAVAVVNLATRKRVAYVHVGATPVAAAVDPAGTRVYVSNSSGRSVSVIDTIRNAVVASIPVGDMPVGIGVHPDGGRVYVANAGVGVVSVIDTATNRVTGTIAVGHAPFAFGDFIGPTTAPAVPVAVVEYYHAGLDHYFITWLPSEIVKLDAGVEIRGWARTGLGFNTWTVPRSGTSPVGRFYIPPALGDSHFFGRGTNECAQTAAANPSFTLEDPAFMHMTLPVAGTCSATTVAVYRVFSNRPDANHRYTTSRAVRDAMVAKGWLAEGDGPDLVVMCAPP